MTRFARGGPANKKKPDQASSWSELKSDSTGKRENKSSSGTDNHNGIKKSFNNKQRHGTGFKSKNNNKFKKFNNKFRDGQKDNGMNEYFRKDQRRENRRMQRIDKRQAEKVCYNCRNPGHTMAECQEVRRDSEQGTGICFKCGSTEHTSSSCTARVKPGDYPYAKCFICGEMGHLSKQCPDNPRGLYPNGGCCRICSSVEHYKKDCPELQKQQGIDDMKLSTLTSVSANVDDEEELHHKKTPKLKNKSGPKFVKF